MTDITAVLDEICDLHGFSSRDEARKWLREALDTIKRSRMTHGFPVARITGVELDVVEGEMILSKLSRSITIENPKRKMIGDDGYTLPPDCRPDTTQSQIPASTPHIPEDQTLFQRMLKERESNKSLHPRKYKGSSRGTKKSAPKQSKKKGRIGEYVVTPRSKLTEPRPGTQAREIFTRLKNSDWDHIHVRNEMVANGDFTHYKDKTRNQQALAAVISVKYRYGPRQTEQNDAA